MKAQSSVDYLFTISLGLAVFTAIAAVSVSYLSDYSNELKLRWAQDSVSRIEWALKTARAFSEGTVVPVKLNLPELDPDSYISAGEISVKPKTPERYEVITNLGFNASGSLPENGGRLRAFAVYPGIFILDLPVSYLNLSIRKDCPSWNLFYEVRILNTSLLPVEGRGIRIAIYDTSGRLLRYRENLTTSDYYSGFLPFLPNTGFKVVSAKELGLGVFTSVPVDTSC